MKKLFFIIVVILAVVLGGVAGYVLGLHYGNDRLAATLNIPQTLVRDIERTSATITSATVFIQATGTINSISSSSISISGNDGKSVSLDVDVQTVFVDSAGVSSDYSDFHVGDKVDVVIWLGNGRLYASHVAPAVERTDNFMRTEQ